MLIEQPLGKQFPYDVVIVVSPHPDDSCIAVGGLLYRLSHERPSCQVHVLVMTSGYRGVTDQYLKRYLDARAEASIASEGEEVRHGLQLLSRKPSEPLSPQERQQLVDLKTKIREEEVAEESRVLSFTPHYLRLNIYEEHAITEQDQARFIQVLDVLHTQGQNRLLIHPGIYDAHQTHRLCSQLARDVLDLRYPKLYERWTYESPWTQFHVRSDIIVPLSESAFSAKVLATNAHRSQTERTPYGNLVEGIAVRNAAVMSEILGSFNVNHAYPLGRYVELLARQNDRIVFV